MGDQHGQFQGLSKLESMILLKGEKGKIYLILILQLLILVITD